MGKRSTFMAERATAGVATPAATRRPTRRGGAGVVAFSKTILLAAATIAPSPPEELP